MRLSLTRLNSATFPMYSNRQPRASTTTHAHRGDIIRDADTFARIEQRAPVIDHLLVAPPAPPVELPNGRSDEARALAFCSQHKALQRLQELQPTHLFPEARIHDASTFHPQLRAEIAREFADYPANSVTPAQLHHLTMRAVADIYAALSGARIRGSLSVDLAAQLAQSLHSDASGGPLSVGRHAAGGDHPIILRCDLSAEDMARRIEGHLGRADVASAKVAVVSQYPFALAAHLNPYIRVRVHDCTSAFFPPEYVGHLHEQRRQMLAFAAERKLGRMPAA